MRHRLSSLGRGGRLIVGGMNIQSCFRRPGKGGTFSAYFGSSAAPGYSSHRAGRVDKASWKRQFTIYREHPMRNATASPKDTIFNRKLKCSYFLFEVQPLFFSRPSPVRSPSPFTVPLSLHPRRSRLQTAVLLLGNNSSPEPTRGHVCPEFPIRGSHVRLGSPELPTSDIENPINGHSASVLVGGCFLML